MPTRRMTNQFGFASKSIAVVLGTRPEIVKLAHIIHLLGDAARVVHTGQHYDPNLSEVFFREMELPPPDHFLEVGSTTRGHQIGQGIKALDEYFASAPPQVVMVQGDTNAVAAGALAANAREIFLCHIEGGLRSHDRAMPEEHNRVITDHLSDLCCAPTELSVDNLVSEGIPTDRIALTGNTVVEAVQRLLPSPSDRAQILDKYELVAGQYALSTFHRPENVDDPATFSAILRELTALPVPVLLPLHPRSVNRAREFGLDSLLDQIRVEEPIGYREFLGLEAESAVMISDSGGIAEEASVVKRPLVVVRNSTERPEVMGTFATLVPAGPGIGREARRLLEDGWAHLEEIPSPYGDGSASRKSLEALAARL
ncbi:MAG: non-hydrolyzing UDP-N-acetylglucosamine 2-epimerase [Acidimicrobiia bacterium]